MLFDFWHIFILAVGAIAISVALVLACKFIKSQDKQNLFLKWCAILTVAIHISEVWVDYFSQGYAQVDPSIIIPLQPCHLSMWFLVILAFKKNKEDRFFKTLAEITFYLGTIGGAFGVLLNFSYADNPTLADWFVLQGFLSHYTLIAGSLYLKFGGYIQIRVKNMISIVLGLSLVCIYGWFVVGLHLLLGLAAPNSMLVLEGPYPALPWINIYTIAAAAVVVLFIFTSLYEQFTLKPEDRWYKKIKFNRKKNAEK